MVQLLRNRQIRWVCILAICYCLSLKMGCVDLFQAMLGKIGFGRAFTLSLIKVGCSGGLALGVSFKKSLPHPLGILWCLQVREHRPQSYLCRGRPCRQSLSKEIHGLTRLLVTTVKHPLWPGSVAAWDLWSIHIPIPAPAPWAAC